MKQIASALRRVAAATAFAAALAGCARNEYAMLPKTSSYHGDTHRAVAVKPAAPVAEQTEQAPAAEPVVAPAIESAAPAQAAATPQPRATKAERRAVAAATAPAAKPNFVQKALVAKMLKKADKMAAKAQVKKHSNAASADEANALSKNIKLGLIFLILGVVLGLFIPILGLILILIGAVFLVLGLLDEV